MYLSYYKDSPYWPKSQNVSGRPLRDIVANIAIFGRVLFGDVMFGKTEHCKNKKEK